ncbi:hypothetical protein D2E70_16265 [Mycobacteroides abscessus]|uniref:hypothetical protein n=1 Tax=Mycobacteroides abscessus TaxID=36809 RepID=UPI000E682961|nr:hypothetical protein [Mycobacteroides abscessus]RIS67526.1 hypothetical protein D2E70_16265 [Mycobacteroides abscessus]
MSTRKIALIAATAAAAVALSACSGTAPAAPKPWPSAGNVAAAPTSATVKTPTYTWQDVDGQGHEGERDATQYRAQFGLDPLPGVEIIHAKGSDAGDTVPCTLGPAVATGYLTAGHCAQDYSADQYLMGSPTGDPRLLGTATPVVAGPVDAAVIETSRVSAGATEIGGSWPVAGVLTAAGVQQLVPLGSYVCFDGAVSGVRCGARLADAGEMIQFASGAQHGDSGSPVFLVNGDGRAALVGIVTTSDLSTVTTATYLETALMATGTAVRLDPHTTPFDAPQRGVFSQRISTR